MSDRWTIALMAAVFAGAVAAVDGHVRRIPLAVAAGAMAAALAVGRGGGRGGGPGGPPGSRAAGRPPAGRPGRRLSVGRPRPSLVCLAAGLLAASLAQRSLAGLTSPLATGPMAGEVTLVGDPDANGHGGVGVDVRLGTRRLRATAQGAAAATLDDRLAGERVTLVGDVDAPGPNETRLRYRHIAGRLAVTTVVGWRPGDPLTRVTNGLRRTLAHGARVLPPRQRALLAGVTLGDDRDQPPDMTDAFRAAGLTHLLAVSGQNLAFFLVIVAPLLTRLRFASRLVATMATLGAFAVLTRAEPSVLRATAMASVSAVGAALGRPATAVRMLALGVAGMLLVDPLLVTSLGFRLSVAGTGGIVVGAQRLESVLPGPRWLAAPLSVTLAAQAAVAPLLVGAFGSVPVASVPANLLAVPVAGPLMVWGLTAGLAAGLVPTPVARLLHVPTGLMLAWLDGVARAAAGWPLGQLRAPHLVALAIAATAGAIARALAARRTAADRPPPGPAPLASATAARRTIGLRVALAVTAGIALAVAANLQPSARAATADDDGAVALGPGATGWHAGGGAVVEVDGRATDAAVLAGLRDRGVDRLDAVVVRTRAPAAAAVVATLRRRWPRLVVVAPPGAPVPGAVAPPTGTVLTAGALRLTVLRAGDGRLDVRVGSQAQAKAQARAPPAGPMPPGHPRHRRAARRGGVRPRAGRPPPAARPPRPSRRRRRRRGGAPASPGRRGAVTPRTVGPGAGPPAPPDR
jgi:competence protein ComEC